MKRVKNKRRLEVLFAVLFSFLISTYCFSDSDQPPDYFDEWLETLRKGNAKEKIFALILTPSFLDCCQYKKNPQVFDLILNALQDKNPSIREAAAACLAERVDRYSVKCCQEIRIVPSLIKVLGDSNARVREEAAKAIAFFKDERAVDGLIKSLDDNWEALYPRELADHFGHTIGPAAASLTLLALGFFILILWIRIRDDVEYLVFAGATILWGLHTAVTLLPRAPLPAPHFAVWWNAVYVLWVVLLCIFGVRFARAQWPRYERGVLAYAAACVPVLYAAAALGALGQAAAIVRLGALAAAVVALCAVVAYALRTRDAVSAMLLATGAVAAAVGARDWLAAQDPQNLRPMYLVPYVALAFFALVGWIMIDRFARTLRQYERLNLELERRVAVATNRRAGLICAECSREVFGELNRGVCRAGSEVCDLPSRAP